MTPRLDRDRDRLDWLENQRHPCRRVALRGVVIGIAVTIAAGWAVRLAAAALAAAAEAKRPAGGG